MKSLTLEQDSASPIDCERSIISRIINSLDGQLARPDMDFLPWAQQNYFIGGIQFRLNDYIPLEAIYKDESKEIIIMKSAQCGASEYCIAYSFYFPLFYNENVFYGMPAKDQIKDFVQGRIDPRIDESTPLQELIKSTDNTDLKRIGINFLYFRGSQNKRQITTVDAGLLILDEFDQMNQQHVSIMEKRLGDSQYKFIRKLSVPTIPEHGIHREYLMTDQREYYFTCQCGQMVCPDWSKNVLPQPTRNKDAKTPDRVMLICHYCGAELKRNQKGNWIPKNPGAEKRGYHISKLIMLKTDLRALWTEYRDTINLEDFFNSNLGLPYTIAGGKLTDKALNACRRSGEDQDKIDKIETWFNCSMGVDVGRKLNVRVSVKIDGLKHAVYVGTVDDFDELDSIMNEFDVQRCVIDGLPETREAVKFATRYDGRVWLAYYALKDHNKTSQFKDADDDGPQKVLINRTRAMDETAQKLISRTTRLPVEADLIPDFYDQLKAPQRIKHLDRNNQMVYIYSEGNKPDHYYHAEVYDDVADSQELGSVEFI